MEAILSISTEEKAKLCLKKYLILRLHRKRVARSNLCYMYLHYIKYTLIPCEEVDNYISKKFSNLEDNVAKKQLPAYYGDRYYTLNQIDCGDYIPSYQSLSSRMPSSSYYCGLFGYGTSGHAYHSCIGWCGSRYYDSRYYNSRYFIFFYKYY
jgi:hypothetical protein